MVEAVDLSFADDQLKALCSSKRLITARWGTRGMASVGRRLTELCAVDGSDVEHLPATAVEIDNDGTVRIAFDDGELTLVGVALAGQEPTKDMTNADELIIHRLELREAS